jgi:hypothetical protein
VKPKTVSQISKVEGQGTQWKGALSLSPSASAIGGQQARRALTFMSECTRWGFNMQIPDPMLTLTVVSECTRWG